MCIRDRPSLRCLPGVGDGGRGGTPPPGRPLQQEAAPGAMPGGLDGGLVHPSDCGDARARALAQAPRQRARRQRGLAGWR
eukprot:13621058-Alexandrium_andersonii.AAC.1